MDLLYAGKTQLRKPTYYRPLAPNNLVREGSTTTKMIDALDILIAQVVSEVKSVKNICIYVVKGNLTFQTSQEWVICMICTQ